MTIAPTPTANSITVIFFTSNSLLGSEKRVRDFRFGSDFEIRKVTILARGDSSKIRLRLTSIDFSFASVNPTSSQMFESTLNYTYYHL